MRGFWIKLISTVIIACMIIIYQTAAHTYQSMEIEASELKASLEEQIALEEENAMTYKDGTYNGSGIGYSGDIHISVTVSEGRITDITITETSDDKAYLEMAKRVIEEVIAGQSTEGVDTVSGATFSSRGILDAIEDALKGASNE